MNHWHGGGHTLHIEAFRRWNETWLPIWGEQTETSCIFWNILYRCNQQVNLQRVKYEPSSKIYGITINRCVKDCLISISYAISPCYANKLTNFPTGIMPNILKQMIPSLSPLHRMLNRWCEEVFSSRNESSPSSINPVSPDTSPGILGFLGGGGKKREVRSSYVIFLAELSWIIIWRDIELSETRKSNSQL